MDHLIKQIETAIIYISRHGTTETIAKKIKDNLGHADLIDLKKNPKPELSKYQNIILGASIHMGQVHKKTKLFIEKNKEILLQKKLGLFLCCMEEGNKAQEQYDIAFPKNLQNHATANAMMGYEYLLEKMGFLEKMMVKKITGKDQSFSKIDEESIVKFAENFKV